MHTCAVLEGGDLKCWGDGFYGQTGSDAAGKEGDMPNELGDLLLPVNVGGGRQVEGIATGEHHTCVLLDDGHVRCFGRNSYGQLGLGDAEERGNEDGEMAALVDVDLGTGRTATAVAAGTFQTCVILDDGTVKCWGSNSMGSLGLGWPPDAAIGHALVGDESSEIVSALPPVALGTGRPVRISVGSDSTCVVFEDGRVKCWGDNTYGELGISGPSRGASSADMGESLPALALGEDAVDVGVGAGHACALLLSGNVKCWGENTGGRLGLGTNTGELTLPTTNVDLGTGRTAVALSVGQTHACVMLDTTEMKCWGSAASGGLGLGFNTTVGDAGGEMGNALPSVDLGDDDTVFAIGTGNLHTCAVLAGARALKCWGQNEEGQLGLGDTRDRGADVDDMGNALPTIDLGIRP
jgi:alpha-tubulin suppressor-like RCC1 family protein